MIGSSIVTDWSKRPQHSKKSFEKAGVFLVFFFPEDYFTQLQESLPKSVQAVLKT